jgi:hypothetical protein
MSESAKLLTLEFLTWVSSRRRTYAEAMEAWRSTCPRLSIWEDALIAGLIQVESGDGLQEAEVMLTPRGRATLDANQSTESGAHPDPDP